MVRLLRNEFQQALLIYRLIFLHSFLSGVDNFFNLYLYLFLSLHTARQSILSQLFRRSASYVRCFEHCLYNAVERSLKQLL